MAPRKTKFLAKVDPAVLLNSMVQVNFGQEFQENRKDACRKLLECLGIPVRTERVERVKMFWRLNEGGVKDKYWDVLVSVLFYYFYVKNC